MPLPITRLIEAAQRRGQAVGTPVLLTFDSPNHTRLNVVVSNEEPFAVVAPMDLLWINPTDGKCRRRFTRQQSTEFVHTWTEADDNNFWMPQTWDTTRPTDRDFQELNVNVGNTHDLIAADIGAIDVSGAQMVGPLLPRVLAPGQDYAPTETVPRSFVETLTKTAQNLAASVSQQLTSLRSQLTSVRNRVTVVEKRLDDIEIGDGVPKYKHDQIESAMSWEVPHKLGTTLLFVAVESEQGVQMFPASEGKPDNNTLILTFAEPRAGKATIIGVR